MQSPPHQHHHLHSLGVFVCGIQTNTQRQPFTLSTLEDVEFPFVIMCKSCDFGGKPKTCAVQETLAKHWEKNPIVS